MNVIQRLELFRDRAEELRQTRFLRNTLVAYQMKVDMNLIPSTQDQYEVTYTPSPHDEEDLRSFLMLFRRFFWKDDPIINLFAISNLCHLHLTNETYKSYLIKLRQIARYALKPVASI